MATDANNNTSSFHADTMEFDPLDGQQYVEELQDKLVELLKPYETIQEVEDRLRKLYPHSKLIDMAIKEANRSRLESQKSHKIRHHSSSSGASFTGTLQNIKSFAVAKLSNLVRESVVGYKAESELSKYKMALIRFVINDVLELAGDFVRRQKGNFIITRGDIRTAMHADKDHLDLFLSDDKSLLFMENHPILSRLNMIDRSSDLEHSKRGMPFMSYDKKVRNMIDSENSFIRGLKLIIKVFKAQLNELPQIREEVDVIFCNIEDLLELSILILTALEDALERVAQEDEVPYVGSEIFDLAQAEEFHAYFTFTYRRLYHDEDWREAFRRIVDSDSTMATIATLGQSFDLAVKHLLPNYLLNVIVQFFEHFKNFSELYDISLNHSNYDDQLALKETISIIIKTKRAIEELLETELDQSSEFEPIDPKEAESIRVSLERKLAAELQHERDMPLPFMPPPEIYRFSEPDSKENIQFEDSQNHRTVSAKDIDKHMRTESDHIPVIRCATLIKLVERLTYHKYQPNIVDSFLTTYRSFISDPEELLDLLIERFKIPDPPIEVVFPNYRSSFDDMSETEKTSYRHYLKRFRQEYSKPVRMRVINVFKSWIKNHYYDFERHPALLDKLQKFLDEVYQNDKILRSLIVSIKKSIEQKKSSQKDEFQPMLSKEPPPILWWAVAANEPSKFDLLTLHPEEFARQLTLVEFDLFRAIKPSELINVRDLSLRTRKEDKYESSPNLTRMTRHFTLLSYWIRKCIVEVEDFDKRSAIYNRVIEIMFHLKKLNNFTGLLSIGSAIESAPIVRLSHTRKTLTNLTMKILDDYRELNEDHQRKLQLELRRCDPPCIPYLGSYQTKLIHAKEGNKTFMDEVDSISPTLSNDEFHSSFSNSPATPISPRTPLTRATNLPSATSTVQNQFFGGSNPAVIHHAQHKPPSPLSCQPVPNFNNPETMNGGGANTSPFGMGSFIPNDHRLVNHNLPSMPSTPAPSMHSTILASGPPKMINFTKQRIRAGLVAEISNYQNPPYCLTVQPEIRNYIESIESMVVEFVANLKGDNNAEDGYNMSTSVPNMTKVLDDYLFEQSERIEPKNSTKPPRSKSKIPDCWKSPGIKVNSSTTPAGLYKYPVSNIIQK